MDSNEKFWLGIFTLIFAVIVIITIISSNFYAKQDQLVAEMIANGVNPIAAACSVGDTLGKQPTCLVYITGNVIK